MSSRKLINKDSAKNIIPCTFCNPKKYLKFCFSFISYENDRSNETDKIKFFERLLWLSKSPFEEMMFTYKGE